MEGRPEQPQAPFFTLRGRPSASCKEVEARCGPQSTCASTRSPGAWLSLQSTRVAFLQCSQWSKGLFPPWSCHLGGIEGGPQLRGELAGCDRPITATHSVCTQLSQHRWCDLKSSSSEWGQQAGLRGVRVGKALQPAELSRANCEGRVPNTKSSINRQKTCL